MASRGHHAASSHCRPGVRKPPRRKQLLVPVQYYATNSLDVPSRDEEDITSQKPAGLQTKI